MTEGRKTGEFDLISELLAPLADNEAAARLTDDAAAVHVPAGHQLIISTDMLVADVHFPQHAAHDLVANRLLACNISDLAAKGAAPYGCLLTLGVGPDWDDAFLGRFAESFGAGLKKYDLQLWGGDTVSAQSAFVGLTVHGLAPEGQMLTRAGAQDGDDVYVTGAIGDGFLGLQHALNGTNGDSLAAYVAPQPPLAFGLAMRTCATAAIDVSDGLLADLGHICAAGGGDIQIELADVPFSDEGEHYPDKLALLTGGDDLQIAFTAEPEQKEALMAAAKASNTRLTHIGKFKADNDSRRVILLDESGREMAFGKHGYRHF